jgi:hypothetical protein
MNPKTLWSQTVSLFRGQASPSAGAEVTSEVPKEAALVEGFTVQADRPITSAKDDLFDRGPFAKQIAQVIATRSDPSSLVVGLYGPWGDGKTSTLGMVKEALASNPDVIVIDYNPWFYGTDPDAITRSFFKAVGDALEKSGFFSRENLGELLSRFGKMIPQFGDNVAAAGTAITTESLQDTRDRVSAILARHKKRVVVFIDDIDRLDRKDIQTLFKLVRLSGDFSYTTYVLAFDDQVVAEALGEAYGAGNAVAGRSFLEKIIQVPLHLPPASGMTLRDLVFSSCNRVLRDSKVELEQADAAKVGNGLAAILGLEQRTPRQAKLYENAISFAVPILKGEVDVGDLLLIEALRIFYPHLYASIRDNAGVFLSRPEHDDRQAGARQTVINAAFEATRLPEDKRSELERTLSSKLFPRISNMGYGEGWDRVWSTGKRICSGDYFRRYFTYGVPKGDMSDLTVETLIDRAAEGDANAVAGIVDDAIGRDAFDSLIGKLRRREETLAVAAIPGLVVAVAAKTDQIRIKRDIFGDWGFSQAAVLLAHLIGRMPANEREALIEGVIGTTPSIQFGTELLSFCRTRPREEEARGFLSAEEHERLIGLAWSRLSAAADETSFFDVVGDRLAKFVFYVFREGSDEHKRLIRERLNMLIAADPANAIPLVKMVTGTSYSEAGIHPSDFERSTYDSLRSILDVDALYERLRENYADDLEVDEYVRDYSERDRVDRRLARQFGYLHRHAADAPNDEQNED